MADIKNPLVDTFGAYSPQQIAERVEKAGVAKAALPALKTFVLGVLAGAFIALGAAFHTLVMTQSLLGFGPSRLLGGLAFSLGLILVVVGGAELFTGNNLIVMAYVSRKVTLNRLLRNWGLVYAGNFAGALGTALLVYGSGTLDLGNGALATTAMSIAGGKAHLGWMEAFLRGVLCNILVCLAVWLSFAAHSVSDKILAIVFPITAFVALGFEHSIANMYLIPIGFLAGAEAAGPVEFMHNLIPVTLGNIVGGGVFVGLIYWVVYLRDHQGPRPLDPNHESGNGQ